MNEIELDMSDPYQTHEVAQIKGISELNFTRPVVARYVLRSTSKNHVFMSIVKPVGVPHRVWKIREDIMSDNASRSSELQKSFSEARLKGQKTHCFWLGWTT